MVRSMAMRITLPDGSVKEYDGPVAPSRVEADIEAGLVFAPQLG